jgi:hypothetical protein
MTSKELHHERIYRLLREELLKIYGYADFTGIEELAWAAIAPYERARERAVGLAEQMSLGLVHNDEGDPFPGWEPPYPGQEAA